MAHLIKIEDYTSRYEHDMYRYPSHFSRLKQERWERMKNDWQRANQMPSSTESWEELENWFEKKESNLFTSAIDRLRKWTNWRAKKDEEVELVEESIIDFYKDKTMEQLKEEFFEELFQAQLRWASTSLFEESSLDFKYKYDRQLKKIVTELPDNYLIMYYPVMKAGQAVVEMDIIVISPTEVFMLAVLQGHPYSIFAPDKGRYWVEYINKEQKQVVSPLLSISRMSQILQSVIPSSFSSFPLKKVLYSPESMIDYIASSETLEIVDKRNIEGWLEKRRKNPAPIKQQQLEIASLLLQHAMTNAIPRQDEQEEPERE